MSIASIISTVQNLPQWAKAVGVVATAGGLFVVGRVAYRRFFGEESSVSAPINRSLAANPPTGSTTPTGNGHRSRTFVGRSVTKPSVPSSTVAWPKSGREDAKTINATRVVIKAGDITEQKVDAIVNAANSSLAAGSGVCGAIRKKGGQSIFYECRRLGGCPVGRAKVTGAGKLTATWVVHAVGPSTGSPGPTDEQNLRNAYINSLRVAAEKGAKTIAFPSISTGIFGYPLDRAAHTAMEAIAEYCRGERAGKFTEIRMMSWDRTNHQTYLSALQKAASEQR